MSDVLTMCGAVLGAYSAIYGFGYAAGTVVAYFRTAADLE